MQITAGDSHSAALDSNGKVYYWGTFRDASGALGLTQDGKIQKLPVPLAHHLNVKKIASGKILLLQLNKNSSRFLYRFGYIVCYNNL